jgi:hypothetical protein
VCVFVEAVKCVTGCFNVLVLLGVVGVWRGGGLILVRGISVLLVVRFYRFL